MDLQKYVDGIRLTGFPLENKTVEILQNAGWSIISNKYYVDSDKSIPREIDIVAYRAGVSNDLEIITVLIVSCKKSEHSVWSFLARPASKNDQNSVSDPVHFWSNSKALKYCLKQTNWRSVYYARVQELGVNEVLTFPEYQIFALQEMSRGGHSQPKEGKPLGDSAMFDSITSLMKAQFHELSLREKVTRPKPRIYQFNLVSLADTDFLRLDFAGDSINAKKVDSAHYIGSYIFDRNDTFARVHFVRSEAFPKILEDYGRLHNANKKIAMEQIDVFYKDIIHDHKRKSVLTEDFREKIGTALWFNLLEDFDDKIDFSKSFVTSLGEDKKVVIYTPGPDAAVEYMNNDVAVKKEISTVLQEVYRYNGEFTCSNDIFG